MEKTYETRENVGLIIMAIINLMILIGWFALIVIGVESLPLNVKIETITMVCILYVLLFLTRICSMGIVPDLPLPIRMILVIVAIVCFIKPMATVTPVFIEKATYQLEIMITELIQMKNEQEAQGE